MTKVIARPRGEVEAIRIAARHRVLFFELALAVLALLAGLHMLDRRGEARAADQGGIGGAVVAVVEAAAPAPPPFGRYDYTFELPAVGPQEAEAAAPAFTRTALLSHYWPALGGTNCSVFRAGQCVSRMASGEPWQSWINRAAACPSELPFWTTITLPGGEVFTCLDRGGKIVTRSNGDMVIDLLVKDPPVPYLTPVPVVVTLPTLAQ